MVEARYHTDVPLCVAAFFQFPASHFFCNVFSRLVVSLKTVQKHKLSFVLFIFCLPNLPELNACCFCGLFSMFVDGFKMVRQHNFR